MWTSQYFLLFIWLSCLILGTPSEAENVTRSRRAVSQEAYDYKSYLTFKEIEKRLEYLKEKHSSQLSVSVSGRSNEGRNLYLVTIPGTSSGSARAIEPFTGQHDLLQRRGSQTPFGQTGFGYQQLTRASSEKPIIFVDGGIHAREWVSPAAALYAIDMLLESPYLTTDLEWRIMPMVNPDGYAYSHKRSSNRFWRKNRTRNKKARCPGVDLNRNFDVHWEETNHNQCSETYSGTKAFSEPESRAVRDEIRKVRSRVQAYITIHTYGQLFLYPYGYTRKQPESSEVAKLRQMGEGMAKAVFDKYGNTYRVNQASTLGAAAGGSDDWAYIKMKIPYSYTFELQGKVGTQLKFNTRGFDLSERKLPQAVDECWLALQYLGEEIMQQQKQVTRISTDEEEKEPETSLPGLYPVGWKQLLQQVKRVQAEVRSSSPDGLRRDCSRVGNIFVCPHMVFWGSMFNSFKS